MLEKEEYASIKDHLIGLVEDIYETGDVENLEYHLENVLVYFGMKLPPSVPLVRSKEKEPLLKEWLSFNHEYLKSVGA